MSSVIHQYFTLFVALKLHKILLKQYWNWREKRVVNISLPTVFTGNFSDCPQLLVITHESLCNHGFTDFACYRSISFLGRSSNFNTDWNILLTAVYWRHFLIRIWKLYTDIVLTVFLTVLELRLFRTVLYVLRFTSYIAVNAVRLGYREK